MMNRIKKFAIFCLISFGFLAACKGSGNVSFLTLEIGWDEALCPNSEVAVRVTDGKGKSQVLVLKELPSDSKKPPKGKKLKQFAVEKQKLPADIYTLTLLIREKRQQLEFWKKEGPVVLEPYVNHRFKYIIDKEALLTHTEMVRPVFDFDPATVYNDDNAIRVLLASSFPNADLYYAMGEPPSVTDPASWQDPPAWKRYTAPVEALAVAAADPPSKMSAFAAPKGWKPSDKKGWTPSAVATLLLNRAQPPTLTNESNANNLPFNPTVGVSAATATPSAPDAPPQTLLLSVTANPPPLTYRPTTPSAAFTLTKPTTVQAAAVSVAGDVPLCVPSLLTKLTVEQCRPPQIGDYTDAGDRYQFPVTAAADNPAGAAVVHFYTTDGSAVTKDSTQATASPFTVDILKTDPSLSAGKAISVVAAAVGCLNSPSASKSLQTGEKPIIFDWRFWSPDAPCWLPLKVGFRLPSASGAGTLRYTTDGTPPSAATGTEATPEGDIWTASGITACTLQAAFFPEGALPSSPEQALIGALASAPSLSFGTRNQLTVQSTVTPTAEGSKLYAAYGAAPETFTASGGSGPFLISESPKQLSREGFPAGEVVIHAQETAPLAVNSPDASVSVAAAAAPPQPTDARTASPADSAAYLAPLQLLFTVPANQTFHMVTGEPASCPDPFDLAAPSVTELTAASASAPVSVPYGHRLRAVASGEAIAASPTESFAPVVAAPLLSVTPPSAPGASPTLTLSCPDDPDAALFYLTSTEASLSIPDDSDLTAKGFIAYTPPSPVMLAADIRSVAAVSVKVLCHHSKVVTDSVAPPVLPPPPPPTIVDTRVAAAGGGQPDFTQPLSLTVSSAETGAVCRYTLDGSEPSASSPEVPAGGVLASDVLQAALTPASGGTVTVKAIAVVSGRESSAATQELTQATAAAAVLQLQTPLTADAWKLSLAFTAETGFSLYYSVSAAPITADLTAVDQKTASVSDPVEETEADDFAVHAKSLVGGPYAFSASASHDFTQRLALPSVTPIEAPAASAGTASAPSPGFGSRFTPFGLRPLANPPVAASNQQFQVSNAEASATNYYSKQTAAGPPPTNEAWQALTGNPSGFESLGTFRFKSFAPDKLPSKATEAMALQANRLTVVLVSDPTPGAESYYRINYTGPGSCSKVTCSVVNKTTTPVVLSLTDNQARFAPSEQAAFFGALQNEDTLKVVVTEATPADLVDGVLPAYIVHQVAYFSPTP